MSLAWHLRNYIDSKVGEFLYKRFSHTKSITFQVNKKLSMGDRLLPSTSYCPYGTLDRAINYRIRYSFAMMPCQQLVAWRGAFERLVWNSGVDFGVYIGGPYSSDVLEGFFENLDTTLKLLQPVGRHPDVEEEEELARYCFVLALLEEVFCNKSYQYSPLVTPKPKKALDELLAIPQEGWIDDLCDLFALFYERYAHMLQLPHTINPTFEGCYDVGPANADIIIDGCLIEIKASGEQSIRPIWLRHLVGCILLDYKDVHQLHSVGIYMARQGKLVSWHLDEFLQLLTGEPNVKVATLRQEFRACCKLSPSPWFYELL